ncbi:MAG: C39 family peptidase [bacterium]|nr:C39 family peptidase [bacterium]
MKRKQVPFFANTPDDSHCFQAAIQMVLKYFLPDKDYTIEELDKMTAKKEGLWTWPTQGLISLLKMGFEVVSMDAIDMQAFIDRGVEYIKENYGEEVAQQMDLHSDIRQGQQQYKEYLKFNVHKKTVPTTDDIKSFIDQGYLVIANINSQILGGKSGYTGHFVVIFDHDENNLILHDPGLPPIPNRFIPYTLFKKAWEYPIPDAANLMAVKLK